jgi:phosphatidylserine/phosphatidylglycerophosphate/cardiolipin synthase-like enzyme
MTALLTLMLNSSKRLLTGVAVLSLLLSQALYAKDYGSQDGNLDVVYLDDPFVDFTVRNQLAANAQHSIEVISLTQGMDDVGLTFLNGIRQAQKDRGVSVKYLYETFASAADGFPKSDFLSRAPKVIADSSLTCPGEVICGRPLRKLLKGHSVDDFMHIKLVIIDRGTPSEVAVVGGRGYTNFSIRSQDSAFVLRPVDPSKPSPITNLGQLFDDVWKTYHKNDKPIKPAKISTKLASQVEDFSGLKMDDRQKAELDSILKVLSSKPSPDDKLQAFQFRPETTSIFTNDLMRTLQSEKPGGSHTSRAHLPSHNHEVIADLIKNTRSNAQLDTYMFGPTTELKEGIKEAIKNGAKIDIITNGRKAHEGLMPGGYAMDISYEKLAKLMGETQGYSGSINAYFLNADKARAQAGEPGAFPFLHRKMVLIDDHTVLAGSDNLTISAAVKNEELLVNFRDPRMNAFLRQLNQNEIEKYYDKATYEEVIAEAGKQSPIVWCLKNFIQRTY